MSTEPGEVQSRRPSVYANGGSPVTYYNADRVHTSLADAPDGRPLEIQPSFGAKVRGLPRVGGLHHRYVWQEAA